MPRPCKLRRISALPRCTRFGPLEVGVQRKIPMTLDEYESIRLIDLEGLTQEQCAQSMSVARSTVQAIYDSARKKLALCLTSAGELIIAGVDYVLCDGSAQCRCGHCRKKSCRSANSN